ncbi:hypothetical protein PS9374_02890 [Planomonospora sphaerica]|uniref:Uncharacterized protein n=1 Tax=Planomonospora sphaerica TaxID=161355 RepID=A0A171CUF6_9ACTN|nr:hypothetical protein [Planomonospora sphaerica]GAT67237.1 hypothetical protein PS9374_02890 [Planomonospora sphaerica]
MSARPRCDGPAADPDWAPSCSADCLVDPEDPPPPWLHERVMDAIGQALQRRRQKITELERIWKGRREK